MVDLLDSVHWTLIFPYHTLNLTAGPHQHSLCSYNTPQYIHTNALCYPTILNYLLLVQAVRPQWHRHFNSRHQDCRPTLNSGTPHYFSHPSHLQASNHEQQEHSHSFVWPYIVSVLAPHSLCSSLPVLSLIGLGWAMPAALIAGHARQAVSKYSTDDLLQWLPCRNLVLYRWALHTLFIRDWCWAVTVINCPPASSWTPQTQPASMESRHNTSACSIRLYLPGEAYTQSYQSVSEMLRTPADYSPST